MTGCAWREGDGVAPNSGGPHRESFPLAWIKSRPGPSPVFDDLFLGRGQMKHETGVSGKNSFRFQSLYYYDIPIISDYFLENFSTLHSIQRRLRPSHLDQPVDLARNKNKMSTVADPGNRPDKREISTFT
jgi:hypothetical protein